MDFNLADYAQQMPPEERQQMMAQLLRKQQGADQLRNANAQANQYGNLAAISQMANNEGVAGAAQMANKSAQAQYSPVQMGQTGFMLPGSGDMVENPIYTEEKDAARKSTLTLTRERLAQQAELDRQRREDKKYQSDRDEQFRRDKLGSDSMFRETMLALKGKTATGKTLPASEIRRLTDKETAATQLGVLGSTFKDDWAGASGSRTATEAQNWLGKHKPLGMGSSYGDQSNWWQNYNDAKNVIRHELFGSALTEPEKKSFDAANITEGMDAKEVRRRLNQQSAAAARAYNKLKGNLGRGKYDVSEFSDIPVVDVEAAPGGAAGSMVELDKYLKQPASGAPEGVPADVWAHMTPEEKALWVK